MSSSPPRDERPSSVHDGGAPDPSSVRSGPIQPVLDVELEGVLQALFSVRQDLLEANADRPDPRVGGAVDVLQGCTATLRVLLRLVRARTGPDGSPSPVGELLERLAGPFAVLSPRGDVLYINEALSALIGREASVIVETPFEERPWIDEVERRRHYDEALAEGRAETVFALTRPDGRRAMLACTTTLLEGDERLLLVTASLVDEL